VVGFRSEAALINEVRERLARKYPQVSEARLSVTVAQAHAAFADSRVRDFIPLLVERRARQALVGSLVCSAAATWQSAVCDALRQWIGLRLNVVRGVTISNTGTAAMSSAGAGAIPPMPATAASPPH
jgi:hypothetical protein